VESHGFSLYIDYVVKSLHARLLVLRPPCTPSCQHTTSNFLRRICSSICLQMSLLCFFQPSNATADDTRRRPAAVASAPRLPALRPEDVLFQRDMRGNKIILGAGCRAEVRRRRRDGDMQAPAPCCCCIAHSPTILKLHFYMSRSKMQGSPCGVLVHRCT